MTDTREQAAALMLKTLREAAEPVGTMRADCFLLLDALLSDEGRPLLENLLPRGVLVPDHEWFDPTDAQVAEVVEYLKERGVLVPRTASRIPGFTAGPELFFVRLPSEEDT